ncbi:MAG: hypothetical protein AAF997_07505 [Myxococcota bacterium]
MQWRTVLIALLAFSVHACSGDPEPTVDEEPCEALGTCVDNVEATVCGEAGLGFLFHSTGGSFLSLFQIEFGHRYVIVDPSCRFSTYEMVGFGIGVAVEGTLTPKQVSEVNALLDLRQWEGLEPQPGGLCQVPDAGELRVAWGDRVTYVAGACAGSNDELWTRLQPVRDQLPDLLRSFGEPTSGPLRYALTRVDPADAVGEPWDDAPEWPLDIPASVAAARVDDEDGLGGYASVQVFVATDAEAAALRALRGTVLDTTFLPQWIPVRDGDGANYQLELRDVLQFETADGIPLVPWAAEPVDQD